MWRVGVAELADLEGAVGASRGVPAREAAAEEGLVGETEPPLERCDEFQPSLVGEVAVEDGMVDFSQSERSEQDMSLPAAQLVSRFKVVAASVLPARNAAARVAGRLRDEQD